MILNQARKIQNDLNIKIYGPIGKHSWWNDEIISSDDIYKELEEYGEVENINIYINSPGGSVTEGCAIYTALKRHPANVNVYIDGQCSSIASVIAMAGDKIIMSPVATMMIHNPITALAGEAKDMRHIANVLDLFKETIINAYTTKSKLSRDEISKLMDETTYFSAKEAIEKGFATDEMQFDIKNSEFANIDDFKIGNLEDVKNMDQDVNKTKKEVESMSYKNVQELEAQNKDLVAEIKSQTKEEVLAEERKRIQDLDALNEKTKGICKDIIDKAKLEGKTKAEILENVLEEFANKTEEKEENVENKDSETVLNLRRKESKTFDNLGEKAEKINVEDKDIEKDVKDIVDFINN